MTKKIKRMISVVLIVLMATSLFGCGGKKTDTSNEVADVTFPLEEPVTFTFMIKGTESVDFKEKLANNKLWKELKEKTNVNIEFQFLGDNPSEKLTLLMNSGGYGDVLWGTSIINSTEASKYIAAGKLTDITNYLTKDLMPNFTADIAEDPETWKNITAADGKVYTLPKIDGNQGKNIESPIRINKAWLDKLGLPVPTTLDEFTNVLRAFATKDPNGNGLPDEIPYLCSTSHTAGHLEALLGMWGIATKDGSNDAYVQVVDGKVKFVPTMDSYKEAIKYLNQLYEEGLMWSECFTSDAAAYNAKLSSDTCVVGCYTVGTINTAAYGDDYIVIEPPKVEGYEPCWYVNPAVHGSKNQFYVMDKCKNVSVLMAWVDQFYDLNTVMRYEYGEVGAGRIELDEKGKYTVLELDTVTSSELNKKDPTLVSLIAANNSVRGVSISDYENKVNLSAMNQLFASTYEKYEDILNKEIWPRPYYPTENAYDADIYFTDINYQVNTYRALWVTGQSDIEKDWNGFVAKLDSLHLDEYISILQKAYDACLER